MDTSAFNNLLLDTADDLIIPPLQSSTQIPTTTAVDNPTIQAAPPTLPTPNLGTPQPPPNMGASTFQPQRRMISAPQFDLDLLLDQTAIPDSPGKPGQGVRNDATFNELKRLIGRHMKQYASSLGALTSTGHHRVNTATAIKTGKPPTGLTSSIRCRLNQASPETREKWENAQMRCAMELCQISLNHHTQTITREKETQQGLQAQLEQALQISSLPEADLIFLERKWHDEAKLAHAEAQREC